MKKHQELKTYIYTQWGGALYVGPPWDFDAWTFGLYGTKYLSCNKSALYYSQLLKDPVFVNRLKEKWTVYKQIWEDKMPSYIDNLYNEIHRAAERNEKMWPDWHPLNRPNDKSYHELIDDMKNSLYTQLSWLDEEISKF